MSQIERMLVCSTGNISEDTCNNWLPWNTGTWWPKGDYGWFVYVVDDFDDYDLPEDLKAALMLAQMRGLEWVMFDRDAEHHPDLQEFEW